MRGYDNFYTLTEIKTQFQWRSHKKYIKCELIYQPRIHGKIDNARKLFFLG